MRVQGDQVFQISRFQFNPGLARQAQGRRSRDLLAGQTLHTRQLTPVIGALRLTLQQRLLPAHRLIEAFQLVVHAHQQAVPDVIGSRVLAHHLLGQRNGLAELPQLAVSLHQQLTIVIGTRQGFQLLDRLGVALLLHQQASQILPVLQGGGIFQLLLSQRLAQPVDRLGITLVGDGNVGQPLGNQRALQAPVARLRQGRLQQLSCLAQITCSFCLGCTLNGNVHFSVDLLGQRRGAQQAQQH